MTLLLRVTRVALATVVILSTAFWGLVITFSDYPTHWSTTRWILYIVASHLPGAFIAGLLLPHRWWIALLAGTGAVLVLIAGGLLAPALLLIGSIGAAAYAGPRAAAIASRSLGARGRTRSILTAVLLPCTMLSGCIPYLRSDDVWKYPAGEGVVLDARTEQPVSGATILWVERRKSAVTDDSGRFTLPGMHGPPFGIVGISDQIEKVTIVITHPQYRDLRFVWNRVLYGRPVQQLGKIDLTPRQ